MRHYLIKCIFLLMYLFLFLAIEEYEALQCSSYVFTFVHSSVLSCIVCFIFTLLSISFDTLLVTCAALNTCWVLSFSFLSLSFQLFLCFQLSVRKALIFVTIVCLSVVSQSHYGSQVIQLCLFYLTLEEIRQHIPNIK